MSHPEVTNGRETDICIGQDEASAPAPIQSSDSPHLENASLQQTQSAASGQNITAIAPVLQSPGQERMEDRRDSTTTTPPVVERSDVSDSTTAATTEKSNLLPLLHTSTWLIFFSILGTLARLGLSGLTTYPGSPLSGVIWANFAGCVVMGFLIEDLRLFTLRPPPTKEIPSLPKATLPLYLGLTTGFCGSLTSFSSFLLVAFDNLSNTLPAYDGRPTKGYNLLAALAYLTATLSLSFSGLQFGAQIALFAQPVLPSLPYRLATALDWVSIPLAAGVWAGAAAMCVRVPEWRGAALYACVFAPTGAYARFWVSRWLNPRVRTFPVGTFVVNVVGTAVLAGVVVGRYRGGGGGCEVWRGVGDGFCGCFTTVSTFMVEVRGLRGRFASLG